MHSFYINTILSLSKSTLQSLSIIVFSLFCWSISTQALGSKNQFTLEKINDIDNLTTYSSDVYPEVLLNDIPPSYRSDIDNKDNKNDQLILDDDLLGYASSSLVLPILTVPLMLVHRLASNNHYLYGLAGVIALLGSAGYLRSVFTSSSEVNDLVFAHGSIERQFDKAIHPSNFRSFEANDQLSPFNNTPKKVPFFDGERVQDDQDHITKWNFEDRSVMESAIDEYYLTVHIPTVHPVDKNNDPFFHTTGKRLLELERKFYQMSDNSLIDYLSKYALKDEVLSIHRPMILQKITEFKPEIGLKMAHIFLAHILKLNDQSLQSIADNHSISTNYISYLKKTLLMILRDHNFWSKQHGGYLSNSHGKYQISSKLINHRIISQSAKQFVLDLKLDFVVKELETQKYHLEKFISSSVLSRFSSSQIFDHIEKKYDEFHLAVFILFVIKINPDNITPKQLSDKFNLDHQRSINQAVDRLTKYIDGLHHYDLVEFDGPRHFERFLDQEFHSLISDPSNDHIKDLASFYHIDPDYLDQFIAKIHSFVELLGEDPRGSMIETIFKNGLLGQKILSNQDIGLMYSMKTPLHQPTKIHAQILTRFEDYLLTINKSFDRSENLLNYQTSIMDRLFQHQLKITPQDEDKNNSQFLSSSLLSTLSTKITEFFKTYQIDNDINRQIIFYSQVLAIPKISIDNLHLLTNYDHDFIEELAQSYRSFWTGLYGYSDKSIKTFSELEAQFFNLSASQIKNLEKNLIFVLNEPIDLNYDQNSSQFYPLLSDYYTNTLTTKYDKHVFLALIAQLQFPCVEFIDKLHRLYFPSLARSYVNQRISSKISALIKNLQDFAKSI